MLVPAAQYLTYAEAVALYQALQSAGVAALVKTHGPATFPFGDGLYYQLLVEETEAEVARETVAAFEAARPRSAGPHCPKCGASEAVPVPRPKLWQRLYFAGTTLRKCLNCGKEFPS